MQISSPRDWPIFVTASGNRGPDDPQTAPHPGIHRSVTMIGAVDSGYVRSAFSRFVVADNSSKRALFLVAPGGHDSSGAEVEYPASFDGEPFFGTSIATAYAAGTIARSLAAVGSRPRNREDLQHALAASAFRFDGWRESEHGKGMVLQLHPSIVVGIAAGLLPARDATRASIIQAIRS